MHRADALLEGDEPRRRSKALDGSRVESDDRADIIKFEIVSQLLVGQGLNIFLEDPTGMKFGEVMAVVVEIDRAADELPAGALRDVVITQSSGSAYLDARGMDIFLKGPAWLPARIHGHEAVETSGTVQIEFY